MHLDESKKRVLKYIIFYVLSLGVLGFIWLALAIQCFSLYDVDWACKLKQEADLKVFYLISFIWLISPLAFSKLKEQSTNIKITVSVIVAVIAYVFINSTYQNYNKGLEDVHHYSNPIDEKLSEVDIDKVKSNLKEIVEKACDNNYTTVYTNEQYKLSGIYECNSDHYVFFVKETDTICEFSESPISGEYHNYKRCVLYYDFGYTYNSQIEKIFPNSIYFYDDTNYKKELKIALEAQSESNLLELYGEKLFNLVKDLSRIYNGSEYLALSIYYNDNFSDVKTTYDKMFLNTELNDKNTSKFDYIKSQKETAKGLLESIFLDKNKFPESGRQAVKTNRHISTIIKKPIEISKEEFMNALRDSFVAYDAE